MSTGFRGTRLGTIGTLVSGAGALGALVGLALLASLAVGVSPEQLVPIVSPLIPAVVVVLVISNVWALATQRQRHWE
ncbi:hypothetical protein BRD01_05635 [Halobacteriales archaeon QS_8_65_32]|jgi:uncharacterized membrane protein YeaQ/YmgE (transglycosylase-associated protein family)|nr:MAG: hypothetical protein BRD01_05635 [Halobacteriales archaeon QS_8_65_32]